jgi:cell division protein FtsN
MNSRCLVLLTILVMHNLSSQGQFNSQPASRHEAADPDLVIQVGAFRHESYSAVLKEKLAAVIDKTVIVVEENGFYKVRITGFSSQEEMEEYYSTLSFLGLKNFWAFPVHRREDQIPLAAGQADSVPAAAGEVRPLSAEATEDSAAAPAEIVLQVDVFHSKSEALDAQKKITSSLNLPVEVVQEWEYYKVFVTGFQSADDASKYFSAIAKLGFPKISLIRNYNKK